MLALCSFGREFGMNTFPLLLAQPLTRARIWCTKTSILAGTIATVWIMFLLSWVVWRTYGGGSLESGRHGLLDDNGAPTLLVLSPLIFFASGLWVSFFLRQIIAAFWFPLLIPVTILVL